MDVVYNKVYLKEKTESGLRDSYYKHKKYVKQFFFDESRDYTEETYNGLGGIFEEPKPIITIQEKLGRIKRMKDRNRTIKILRKDVEDFEIILPEKKNELLLNIDRLIIEVKAEIVIMETVDTIDKLSNEKHVVFSGVKDLWYDAPLQAFLASHEDQIKRNGINQFIRWIAKTYEKAGEITVNDDWGRIAGTIPKSALIFLLQQILIISVTSNTNRINRAVFQLHHEYQISPRRIANILELLELLECKDTCIIKRSGKEFLKGDIPKWVLKVSEIRS